MRAEHPQTEFTSTIAVPALSTSAASTSSAVRSSANPTSIRSRRIGVSNRSSYIVRGCAGDPACVMSSWRRSVLISDLYLFFAPHQRENRALRDDQVCLALEGDLDGCLPEKKRVVTRLGLHGYETMFARTGAPRLVAHLRRIRHRQSGSRRDDFPALHGLAVDSSGRQVEPYLRALLTLFRLHQYAIADDDQFLFGHGEM